MNNLAKIALTATIALAITLTFNACEEKKKQDGTTTTATEPAAEAATQEAVAEKPAENAGGGDTQDGCPNAVTGNGTLSCGGQTYKTVKIGEQVWMAENLNFEAKGSKCYGEGGKVTITQYEEEDTFITLSKAKIQANCTKYGRLYNWATAKTVCPEGWHLPSNADWNVLKKFVDPSCDDNSCVAGTKLKAKNSWNNKFDGESSNGTDAYGFSALPSGAFTSSNGNFYNDGYYGYWWGASDDNILYNWSMDSGQFLNNTNFSDDDSKGYNYSFSVRCIKD
jgi:uncharacterized protein (TIGR02145 family)